MALLGLLPPNARVTGSVKLTGRELLGLSDRQLRQIRGKDVAVIFQEPMTALNPVYTIGFQIVESLRLHENMGPKQAKARAIELLEMVELPDPPAAFDKYPHQLSGGQRQRAMIAISISCDPLLLIADEPTTALDVTVQAEILDLLRDLRTRLNSAIILITHDLGVVADLADKIIVMKDGLIVERGSVDDIYARPEHPYTKQLLAAVPHLGAAQDRRARAQPAGRADAPRSSSWTTSRSSTRSTVACRRSGLSTTSPSSIGQGEVVGLVGESGSGKTTIGRAAVGLLPVVRGRAARARTGPGDGIQDRAARHPQADRHRLPGPGLVAEPALPDRPEHRRAAAARRGGAGARRSTAASRRCWTRSSCRDRSATATRTSSPEVSVSVSESLGHSRCSPKLLVADEPTSALDVSVQARFLHLLKGLQEELQFACLFVSHDLGVVDELAHRIVVLQQGTPDRAGHARRDPAQPEGPVHPAAHRGRAGAGSGGAARASPAASRGLSHPFRERKPLPGKPQPGPID